MKVRLNCPRRRYCLLEGRLVAVMVLVGTLTSSGAFAESVVSPASRTAVVSASNVSLEFAVAFDRATLDYESGHYEQCVDAFRALLAKELPPSGQIASRAQMSTYLSACLVASGKLDAARQQIREAILENRHMIPPDPIVFPRAVVDLFVQVRNELMATLQRQQEEELARSRAQVESRRQQDVLEKQRVLELERLIATETVIRQNERWMAWVPFGIGQFHNGDAQLGWLLLTAETVLAVTALTATSVELGLHSQGEGGRSNLDAVDLTQKISQSRDIGTVSWLSLLGVALAGIAEAHLSYRSEVSLGTRPRGGAAAPRSRLEPEATILPRGDNFDWSLSPVATEQWLGVRGRF